MIRRPSASPQSKDNTVPRSKSTSFTYSAIKSEAIEEPNRHERTNMTFHPPHIHFNVGHHSRDTNITNNIPKRIDLGSFYKKRDDVRLLTNQLPTTTFPDITKSPCAFKKEHEEGSRYPLSGQPRSIFSTGNTNKMGVILEEDRDDQMIFPWKELEKDFGIFTNHSPNQILNDFSKISDRPALTSAPSPPFPALSKKHVISNNLSADGDSTIPSFSWLDSQILHGPEIGSDSGPDNDKLRIGSLTIREDGGKGFSENHLDNAFIDKNNAINSRFSAQNKHCKQSKDIISSTRHKHWSEEEDEMLRRAMASEETPNWSNISLKYFHSTRSESQCKNRWKNHLQPGIVRGRWNPSEDQLILKMVAQGYLWKDIASQLPGRIGESVRERFMNHLDPTLKKSKWTKEEDDILFENQRKLGNKWSEIRKLLPGRSHNSIKNRYHNRKNSYLRKIKQYKQDKNRKNANEVSVKGMKEEGNGSVNLAARPNSLTLEDVPDIVVGI